MGYGSILHNHRWGALVQRCAITLVRSLVQWVMAQYFITRWGALVQWCAITLMKSFLQWIMAQYFITC